MGQAITKLENPFYSLPGDSPGSKKHVLLLKDRIRDMKSRQDTAPERHQVKVIFSEGDSKKDKEGKEYVLSYLRQEFPGRVVKATEKKLRPLGE